MERLGKPRRRPAARRASERAANEPISPIFVEQNSMRCLGCARHGKKASANLQPHHAFKVSTNHSSTMAIRVKIDFVHESRLSEDNRPRFFFRPAPATLLSRFPAQLPR